jgi:hypothetical protein
MMKNLIKLVMDRKSEIYLVGYFLFLGCDEIGFTILESSRHEMYIFSNCLRWLLIL